MTQSKPSMTVGALVMKQRQAGFFRANDADNGCDARAGTPVRLALATTSTIPSRSRSCWPDGRLVAFGRVPDALRRPALHGWKGIGALLPDPQHVQVGLGHLLTDHSQPNAPTGEPPHCTACFEPRESPRHAGRLTSRGAASHPIREPHSRRATLRLRSGNAAEDRRRITQWSGVIHGPLVSALSRVVV
jgi:hypothetical protein